MRSVADDLREELQKEVLRLSFEERMALALQLGERGLEMFCQASGLDRDAAIRELQRQRQASRTPSKCMSELIG
jgi:dsDNA-binding SOS-regulon protein